MTDPNHPAPAPVSSHADPVQAARGQVITRRVASVDGKRILVTSAPRRDSPVAAPERRQGTACVWDAASGKPVFPA